MARYFTTFALGVASVLGLFIYMNNGVNIPLCLLAGCIASFGCFILSDLKGKVF
jgi:Na+/H+ antiporter NhaC